jgi:iron complex outermembrane receptor protein
MDVRGENGAELVTSIGTNLTGAGIELNGTGRARVDDYRLSYGQARFRSGRLFTQAFVNVIDAGDSRFLRTGLPVVDRSRVYAFQMQHGADVGSTALVYGIDAQRTDTRTGGTITGRFEDDDRVDEAGAYVHAVTRLSDRFETVAALRVDAHNRLEKPVLSPRAALVFRPREGHTLRATFNRAFRTPAVLDLFLDLQAGRLPITPTIFYDLRGVGVGEDGYTFNTCEGGFRSLCMRVPGASGELPANAALVWDQLIAALAPDLASLLPNPGSAVGTVLRRFDAESAAAGGAPFRLDPNGPTDIDRLRPTITNTLEAGYKGLLKERLLLTANVYYSRLHDFVGPITVETPNVFLDPAGTATYVGARLAPLVSAGAIDQATVDALIAGLSAVPVGTIVPSQWDAPDILLTYRNFGRAELWGFEVGADVRATERLALGGSLSVTSTECFDFDDDGECTSDADRSLNAPSAKGNVFARWEDAAIGFSAGAALRLMDGFPQATGVFVGDVPGYTLLDATVGYRLPRLRGATVTLSATNVLDRRHRELIGAPELGRLVLLRLRYDF